MTPRAVLAETIAFGRRLGAEQVEEIGDAGLADPSEFEEVDELDLDAGWSLAGGMRAIAGRPDSGTVAPSWSRPGRRPVATSP